MSQEVVHADPEAFDMLLASNGVVMQHFRAIKCPLGVEDRFDVRSHDNHSNCSNGFIYKLANEVTVAFSGNSSHSILEDMGVLDGSSAVVSIPRTYDNSEEEVYVQHYDRFFFKDVQTTTVTTQTVEAHITGTDRLQYPVTKVELVIDMNGIEYGPDDYEIKNGCLVWTNPQRRPQFDPKLQRGQTYSIRYRYQSFYYVKNIIHEVRVQRTYDHAKQEDVVVRLPYQVLLQREYVFENESRSKDGTSDARDIKSARSGAFGPR